MEHILQELSDHEYTNIILAGGGEDIAAVQKARTQKKETLTDTDNLWEFLLCL